MTRTKRIFSFAISLGFIAPLLTFGAVQAVDSPSSTPASPPTATTTDSNASEAENQQEIKKTADDIAALKARLETRKTALKTKLTAAQQALLKTKCVSAQGLISSVRGKVKGIETSRTEVYDNLVDRLTSLSTKLKAKDVDTTELNTEITELEAKIKTFQTDLAAYKQAVTDLAAMDCKTDPTAFKASLETARTAQAQVKTDADAIKTYVNDPIKVTLKAIRAELQTKADAAKEEN